MITLRKFIDSKRISLRGFSRESGLNIRTICNVIKGKKPSRLTALKIRRYTEGKVTLKDLGFDD